MSAGTMSMTPSSKPDSHPQSRGLGTRARAAEELNIQLCRSVDAVQKQLSIALKDHGKSECLVAQALT